MRETSFRYLEQFLGAYIHQDWDIEYPNYVSMLIEFIASTSSDVIKGVICDFETLLSKNLSEDELADIAFNELGCYLNPVPLGVTYSQWFIDLKRILGESLLGKEPNPVYSFGKLGDENSGETGGHHRMARK